MPVFHFTIHAYRSWTADRSRGYVRRGKGIQPPNPKLGNYQKRIASQGEADFDGDVQKTLICLAHEICGNHSWRLHAAGTDASHIHLIISTLHPIVADRISAKLKNLLSLLMNRKFKTPGKRWFVRGDSHKPVKNREHFNYLITEYLPSHPGVFWQEGKPLP